MAGSGLEGIVVAQTRLSKIDGEAGTLTCGGYSIEELAEHATSEEVGNLLWSGELPTGDELAELRSLLAAEHALPDHRLGLVRSAPPVAVRSEMNQRGKKVYANADFYSASVHDEPGVPPALFTNIFACARVSGWTAHILEQLDHNRLIRPKAECIGPARRSVQPLQQRG
ncbi:MAG: citrate/2-methylcitrate synthase [Gemmatimonadota bacterium]